MWHYGAGSHEQVGAERLVRAMRMKLRIRLLVLGLRQRLLADTSAARRRKRPEAVLPILDRITAGMP